ncbi:TusE/DsrC/DsvC family sulfur relay protein [Thiohalophilus thiocyanatoxydans]|uniref:tRNA 2-thiouridine synthesizing protein E n=1 Tax=Thiohalophilus thiocyanatoxydans TaxID=381308 RepID=A0A4R8IPL4_9GAMM|nr:TusE/DsrC/DsvC family sulfur relay protein [Thiohalophilus thiocyanatoxydans]TDY02871.1 tRNA 2-thiouridine synthesizing protein E [Thiohalophilus thiocyanatoxydans]
MTQYAIQARDSEPTGYDTPERHTELHEQDWNREKSTALAANEGIALNDDHWNVIMYLRKQYLEQGSPRHARSLARELDRYFVLKGGSRYLRQLFTGGPVTQGSRLANLRAPANTTDLSFGTNF